ncbi:MAG: hypothetical protein QG585_166 [Patescibacteria group bacterium]|nr:hypothetical protein [Patescibacteria group bacterium]
MLYTPKQSMQQRFQTTNQEKAELERYYARWGLQRDQKSRLRHFQKEYGTKLYIATNPPFADDEEELGAWEYVILGTIHIIKKNEVS